MRREQDNGQHRPHHRRIAGRLHAVAEGAVADLVVVLQEADEGGRRQVPRRFAMRLAAIVAGDLALEAKPSARARANSAQRSNEKSER